MPVVGVGIYMNMEESCRTIQLILHWNFFLLCTIRNEWIQPTGQMVYDLYREILDLVHLIVVILNLT